MREIKFRVWDKELGLHPVDSIDFTWGDVSYQVKVDWLDKEGNKCFYQWRKSKLSDVMQYTGLKDRNGVEIYEGDIIHIWYTINQVGDPYVREVKYPFDNNLDIDDGQSTTRVKSIEVVGNIYEEK